MKIKITVALILEETKATRQGKHQIIMKILNHVALPKLEERLLNCEEKH